MIKGVCCVPNCNKKIPYWRNKNGFVTCSKKCASEWSHIPTSQREKIRGKKYGRRGKIENGNKEVNYEKI